MSLAGALGELPIIAILRGVKPAEVCDVGRALYGEGIRCIEVPLNSPSPLDSIARLADAMPTDCIVGAGTVLTAGDVKRVKQANGRLVVTPNCFDEVISTSLDEGLDVVPGFASASEAFHAARLGAKHLKLFPAATYGPRHLRALFAVLPSELSVYAVGGIGPEDFSAWRAAGAAGFGIGSELYRAGDSAAAVTKKAKTLREAVVATDV